MGFTVIKPEHLKFKHETAQNKKKSLIIENVAIQTENAKGNVEVFLTVMTLLMLVETQLIKLLRLPLVL